MAVRLVLRLDDHDRHLNSQHDAAFLSRGIRVISLADLVSQHAGCDQAHDNTSPATPPGQESESSLSPQALAALAALAGRADGPLALVCPRAPAARSRACALAAAWITARHPLFPSPEAAAAWAGLAAGGVPPPGPEDMAALRGAWGRRWAGSLQSLSVSSVFGDRVVREAEKCADVQRRQPSWALTGPALLGNIEGGGDRRRGRRSSLSGADTAAAAGPEAVAARRAAWRASMGGSTSQSSPSLNLAREAAVGESCDAFRAGKPAGSRRRRAERPAAATTPRTHVQPAAEGPAVASQACAACAGGGFQSARPAPPSPPATGLPYRPGPLDVPMRVIRGPSESAAACVARLSGTPARVAVLAAMTAAMLLLLLLVLLLLQFALTLQKLSPPATAGTPVAVQGCTGGPGRSSHRPC